MMIWAPDPAQPGSGRSDCQVLAAIATDERLYVLAEAPGLRHGGEWSPEQTWFLRVTSTDGALTFRHGTSGESDKERTSIHGVYLIDAPPGQTLDVTLEQGSTPVHQARLTRIV